MEENPENKFKRGVLVTGEGSLHLTIQAFADFLRRGLEPIISVLNNSGCTVERLIHGKTAPYNDVAVWDYSQLATTFGPLFPLKYHSPIKMVKQLVELLGKEELVNPECFTLVELVLDPLDAPQWILAAGKTVEKFNARKSSLSVDDGSGLGL